jgi:hypothetical protein
MRAEESLHNGKQILGLALTRSGRKRHNRPVLQVLDITFVRVYEDLRSISADSDQPGPSGRENLNQAWCTIPIVVYSTCPANTWEKTEALASEVPEWVHVVGFGWLRSACFFFRNCVQKAAGWKS